MIKDKISFTYFFFASSGIESIEIYLSTMT